MGMNELPVKPLPQTVVPVMPRGKSTQVGICKTLVPLYAKLMQIIILQAVKVTLNQSQRTPPKTVEFWRMSRKRLMSSSTQAYVVMLRSALALKKSIC